MSKRKEIERGGDENRYGIDDDNGDELDNAELEDEEVIEDIEDDLHEDDNEDDEEEDEEIENRGIAAPSRNSGNSGSLLDDDDEDEYNNYYENENRIPENEYDPVVVDESTGKKLRMMDMSTLTQSQSQSKSGEADSMMADDQTNAETNEKPSVRGAPMKKPQSMWIRYFGEMKKKFAEENPDIHFTEVAKILAEKYKNLSEEEREKLKAVCDAEKAEYDRYMQENGLSGSKSGNGGASKDFDILRDIIIPQARIRKTMKLDPEVKTVSKDAVVSTTKATELFIAYLGQQALRQARLNRSNVKTLKIGDLINSIHSNAALGIYSYIFLALNINISIYLTSSNT
jgi:hypothetical protein